MKSCVSFKFAEQIPWIILIIELSLKHTAGSPNWDKYTPASATQMVSKHPLMISTAAWTWRKKRGEKSMGKKKKKIKKMLFNNGTAFIELMLN